MEKRSFSFPALLLAIAIPLVLGMAAGLLTRDSTDIYSTIVKPAFAPPAIVFPIVWGILYALMGVSLYLVYAAGGSTLGYILFFAQLALNLLWPFLFFTFEAFTAAFVCLILLWILILLMILQFYQVSRPAAWLQLPYLLWVTFAGVLNYFIMVAN